MLSVKNSILISTLQMFCMLRKILSAFGIHPHWLMISIKLFLQKLNKNVLKMLQIVGALKITGVCLLFVCKHLLLKHFILQNY